MTKQITKAFTVGLCTGLFAASVGFAIVFLNTQEDSNKIIENKEINLVNTETKVSSISYELSGVSKKAFVYSEDIAYSHFSGVAIGCKLLVKYDCGIGSKKDAETIIKVLQKSIELGWVK